MKSQRNCVRLLGVVLVLVMLVTSIPFFTASAVKEMFTVLGNVSVSCVAPVAGTSFNKTASSNEPEKYIVRDVNWTQSDDGNDLDYDMVAGDKFKKDKYYYVFIDLEAVGSYTFDSNMTVAINGMNGNKWMLANNGKNIQIYCRFGPCKEPIDTVELNVVNPVVGKTPTFAKVNTDKYYSENYSGVSNSTNGVTWTNQSSGVNLTISNPFKEGGKYTVTYYLTAKDGYAFSNGTTFKINGKTATVTGIAQDADGKDVKVKVALKDIVPGDGKAQISSLDLSVAAPAAGNKPSFDKIQGTGYYSDNGGNSPANYKNGIMWYNENNSSTLKPGTTITFAENNKYSVTIVVLTEDTHKFASTVTAKVNGKIATVERIDDSSVVVKYTFTRLPVSHTHTESGWKTDGTHHWKVCTDSTCGVITTTKTAHLGGTATCTEKAKCSVCGVEYGTTSAHIAGPAPTETTPQTCTECGFVIKPALNHIHKISKVTAKEATCTESGNKEYYKCSGCPTLFSDAAGASKIDENSITIAPKGHTGGDWKSDEATHWRECATCNEVLIETKMLHEDGDEDGKCDTCSYEQAADVESTTTPNTTPDNSNDDKAPISTLTWIIIGIGFVVLVVAMVVVIVLISKKKK